MKKYTAGEWKVDMSEEFIIRVISPWSKDITPNNTSTFADYRGAHICDIHYNTGVPKKGTALANAKLIAKSPELLELLHEITDYWDSDLSENEEELKNRALTLIKAATE